MGRTGGTAAVLALPKSSRPDGSPGSGLLAIRVQTTRRSVQVRASYLAAVVTLAGAYYLGGKVGLTVAALDGNVTPVWPPTGIAIAALAVGGLRLWPGVAAGALLVNGLSEVPFGSACGMAAGNTVEALAGAWLFTRYAGSGQPLGRLREVGALIALVAGLATICSATVGVLSLRLGGVIPTGAMWETWRVWWVGDALGALVVAPVLLLVAAQWGRQWKLPGKARALEAVVLGGLLLVFTWVSFRSAEGRSYLVFPPVIFAALRFGPAGATAGTLTVATMAVLQTRTGSGPFAVTDPAHSLWLLDSFLAVLAVTGLVLAAVVRERNQTAAENAALTATLQRNVDELEFANGELEAFTYSVSHDLRAPLRNIDGFARTLEKRAGSDLDEESRRYLTRVRSNAKSMGVLIDELLAFSRLQRQPLQTRSVQVDDAVTEALALLESERAGRPDLTISVGSMPTVLADRALLVQVFVNLIGNSIKFTRDCDPARITVSAEPDPITGEYVFSVTDTGVGFDMAYVDRLFGVFQRLHRMEDYEGSGVGLALVSRIVNRHGGQVWARGSVGGGATVSFTLGGARA